MRNLFLRWEIEAASDPRKLEMIQVAIRASQCKLDFTCDEFRRLHGFDGHPDPVRGAQRLWEELEPADGDDKGSPEALESARDYVRKNEAGLGEDGWKKKYPKLFA